MAAAEGSVGRLLAMPVLREGMLGELDVASFAPGGMPAGSSHTGGYRWKSQHQNALKPIIGGVLGLGPRVAARPILCPGPNARAGAETNAADEARGGRTFARSTLRSVREDWVQRRTAAALARGRGTISGAPARPIEWK
jgi:hypothetical protein